MPTPHQVTQTALQATQQSPPIPYATMDCQAFVEYCVQKNGGQMDFRGSNHMFREACQIIYSLDYTLHRELLRPGWLLFIVEPVSERTPAAYRTDGLGDASHVGLYVGQPGVEVAHSSASRGIVCASTLKNGWTHCGPALAIDYSQGLAAASELITNTSPTHWGTVTTDQGGLRMRTAPGGEYMLTIPQGARIPILRQAVRNLETFAETQYNKGGTLHTGWVAMQYVTPEGTLPSIPQTADSTNANTITIARDAFAAWLAQAQQWLKVPD